MIILLTFSLPKVKVPVLSKATQLTFPIFSKASPDFIKTPCLEACPTAAIIEVGVARARAQGQNTTKTVTALMISDVRK